MSVIIVWAGKCGRGHDFIDFVGRFVALVIVAW